MDDRERSGAVGRVDAAERVSAEGARRIPAG